MGAGWQQKQTSSQLLVFAEGEEQESQSTVLVTRAQLDSRRDFVIFLLFWTFLFAPKWSFLFVFKGKKLTPAV